MHRQPLRCLQKFSDCCVFVEPCTLGGVRSMYKQKNKNKTIKQRQRRRQRTINKEKTNNEAKEKQKEKTIKPFKKIIESELLN